MQKCEWCNIPQEEKQWLLLESPYWSVYLADMQDYVGRCILVLNRHCRNLSELNMQEWTDLKGIVDRLERCHKEVLGAELCNWSCLMNNFYKKSDPNPHLHIHVRPRYKDAVVLNDAVYEDAEYGHHYALKKEDVLRSEDRVTLFKQKRNLLAPKDLSALNAFASIWCCIENMFLAITAENYAYALRIPLGDESEYVRSVLNFPEDYVMPCYIAIGKPAGDAVYPGQKEYEVEDRIHRNGW